MQSLKQLLKEHTLLFLYSIILLLLLYGVVHVSGVRYLGLMLALIIALYLAYFAGIKLGLKSFLVRLIGKRSLSLSKKQLRLLIILLSVYTVGSIIVHFVLMGGSPPLMSLSLDNADEVAQIRRAITSESNPLMNYVSSFSIRAFLPFLIFYFYVKNQKKAYLIILVIGCFYAFSLMQKSYIITLLAPVFVHALINKNWKNLALYILLMLAVVVGLSFFANPEIRQELAQEELVEELVEEGEDSPKYKPNGVERIFLGLYNRIMIIPGEMVAEWFEKVPAEKPFLYGNGYRIVAKIKGEEFENYQAELYPLIRPNFYKRGLRGNVNTASFMYDYANFGVYGLILSGISLALLFIVIEALFINDFLNKISLNLFSILIISSTALTTTMFSGGWALILVLYLLFLRNNKLNPESSETN